MAASRPFAVFDIDGTLIRWQIFHAIMDQLGQSGKFASKDYEAMLAARRQWKERKLEYNFDTYQKKVVEAIERNLTAINPKDLAEASKLVFEEYKDQVYRYTRDLIRDLKQKGYFLMAISGSPDEAVRYLAPYYGFDDYAATIHEQKDGRHTGEIMVAALHKPELLRKLVAANNLSFTDSIAVGDSEGDIAMLAMVERPIAFNPSKGLFEHAAKNHWKVVLERKSMIYELEPKDGHYRLARVNGEAQV